MEDTSFPVLYILMRNDLASMNPGKAMAQASHAANAFVDYIDRRQLNKNEKKIVDANFELFQHWRKETTQGFGTVLTLSVNENEMRSAVKVAQAIGFISDTIHDPTYPIQIPRELGENLIGNDVLSYQVGESLSYVTIPLDTCAYVFGNKNDPLLSAVVGRFPLHP